jgi:hypothetical protein
MKCPVLLLVKPNLVTAVVRVHVFEPIILISVAVHDHDDLLPYVTIFSHI